MGKIIYFTGSHFQKRKKTSLSPQMITTLLAACKKQEQGIPFGPNNIKGSFMALINRGLLIKKDVMPNYITEPSWEVTSKALGILKLMGIEDGC